MQEKGDADHNLIMMMQIIIKEAETRSMQIAKQQVSHGEGLHALPIQNV